MSQLNWNGLCPILLPKTNIKTTELTASVFGHALKESGGVKHVFECSNPSPNLEQWCNNTL